MDKSPVEEHGSAATAAGPSACDAGVRRAFDFLGKRWNGVILGTLSSGPLGFADLRRGVGAITDSVLSDRLVELAEAGLVERTVTQTRPPGVSYQLTGTGSQLLPILHQLGSWADGALPPARCQGRADRDVPSGC
ncbi:helix-turn-helix domain-containing protein [Microlunatus lacustris]